MNDDDRVDDRDDAGIDQRVGRDQVDVGVVDDGDLARLESLDQILGAAVGTRPCGDDDVGAGRPSASARVDDGRPSGGRPAARPHGRAPRRNRVCPTACGRSRRRAPSSSSVVRDRHGGIVDELLRHHDLSGRPSPRPAPGA